MKPSRMLRRGAAAAAVCAVAALALAAVAVGAATKPLLLSGQTSQGEKVQLRYKPTGGRARKAGKVGGTIAWTAQCESGGQLGSTSKFQSQAARNGSWSGAGEYTMALPNGYSANLLVSASGRIKGRAAATGAFTAIATVLDGQGNTVDHCETGRVTWTAKRG